MVTAQKVLIRQLSSEILAMAILLIPIILVDIQSQVKLAILTSTANSVSKQRLEIQKLLAVSPVIPTPLSFHPSVEHPKPRRMYGNTSSAQFPKQPALKKSFPEAGNWAGG